MGTNPLYPVLVKKNGNWMDRQTYTHNPREDKVHTKFRKVPEPSREAQKAAPTAAFESSH